MPATPPADDDERYAKMLIGHVQDLAAQLGRVRAEVKEDTAQLLRGFREDVHRTTMGIHARILSYEDELVKDRVQRERRQGEIDGQLSAIRNNQRWRVRIEVALVVVGLIVVAFLLGRGV